MIVLGTELSVLMTECFEFVFEIGDFGFHIFH